ncbi:MAG: M23 family metallopeptidase [bacterium]|nr:M23 family metallopeptidase [bacterium]
MNMEFFKKHWLKILLVIASITVVFVGAMLILNTENQTRNEEKSKQDISSESPDLDEPPLKLKSIGIDFEDFKFTKAKLQFGRLFMGYGFYIPAGNDNPAKYNPQPTFVVPLGTPVRAIVDGVVADMPTLWSGDISVRITENGKLEKWSYETEHLINPKVKVGDRVSAGQILGEVSDFNHGAPAGFGTVEIGIGIGGNPPHHICPFAYLDDSIKDETFTKMNALFRSWEEYIGDTTLYDESALIPGCLTLDLIEG